MQLSCPHIQVIQAFFADLITPSAHSDTLGLIHGGPVFAWAYMQGCPWRTAGGLIEPMLPPTGWHQIASDAISALLAFWEQVERAGGPQMPHTLRPSGAWLLGACGCWGHGVHTLICCYVRVKVYICSWVKPLHCWWLSLRQRAPVNPNHFVQMCTTKDMATRNKELIEAGSACVC